MRLLALACLLAAAALQAQAPPGGVRIVNLAQAGAFELEATDAPVSLSMHAAVEKQTATGWVTVADNLLLAAACHTGEPPQCVELAAGGKLRPVRWTGWSCSGQCNHHCKKNVYAGPGTFRLTVFSCDRSSSTHGPSFQLPASPGKR